MIVTVRKNVLMSMVAGLVFILVLMSFSGCGSKAKKLLDQYEALANDYTSATTVAKSNDFVDKINAKTREIIVIGDSLTDYEKARYEEINANVQLAAKAKKIDKLLSQFEQLVSEYAEINKQILAGNFFALADGTAKMYEITPVIAEMTSSVDDFTESQRDRFNTIYQIYQETRLMQD
jgi:hypothetical protein